MTRIKLSNRFIGDQAPCFLVAEIGINHNGSLDLAKALIDVAQKAGCDAVKFQKRTVEVVYTPEELAKPRESPFGTTNGDLKRGLEFGAKEFAAIDAHCKARGIPWFASCWDEGSVDFIDGFGVPCYKIASASMTDDALLRYTRAKAGDRPIFMATGMSTQAQVDHALAVIGNQNLVLMHTCSVYPSAYNELNLSVITTFRNRYQIPIGYSGHESGLATSVAAVALGACVVERHITLDRAMWGSDQAASVGPSGLNQLVRDIRLVETAMGSPEKRLMDREIPILQKLRRKGA
jgi:N-acetylneuraminate synthase